MNKARATPNPSRNKGVSLPELETKDPFFGWAPVEA